MAVRVLGGVVAAWLVALPGCVPAGIEEAETPASQATVTGPVAFDYVTRDGSHVTALNTRGRVTVIVFITTYDLPSQFVARELADLMRRKTPRFNALGVVLEPPKNAPLVDAFAATLELPFPLALTERPGTFDEGPFGKVEAVPTIVVLDRSSGVRVRHVGAMTVEALDQAITAAGR